VSEARRAGERDRSSPAVRGSIVVPSLGNARVAKGPREMEAVKARS